MRLCVGIEHDEDVLADLEQALAVADGTTGFKVAHCLVHPILHDGSPGPGLLAIELEISHLLVLRPWPSWRGGRIASLRHIAARKFHRLSSFRRSAA